MIKEHKACRVCGSTKLTVYLDLGLMPLSNNLLDSPDRGCPMFPLQVMLCEDCGLSQLSVVIDPQVLFGHYVYRSSMSETYKEHCHNMALELGDLLDLNENSFHIDIAGNDGALLHEFKKLYNHKALNIDPAENLEKYNEENGIRYFKTFWGIEAAKHLHYTQWPQADLITATNVFAHVDNVQEFLLACKAVLKPEGVLILEFPYIVDFIEKMEFDTVYFEHLSYFSVGPLRKLCESLGMALTGIQHFDIHGGSIRCYIRGSIDEGTKYYPSVQRFEQMEISKGFKYLRKYEEWAKRIAMQVAHFSNYIRDLSATKKIWGFAASAKGNTLLNAAKINNKHIPYIIDETPEKIGKYSPGLGIQIVPLDPDTINKPDYIVILSWNFWDEITDKLRAQGFKGQFINPLDFTISI